MSEGLPIKKVADILGVCTMTVRRWVKRGYLRGYRVGGLLIVPRTEIPRIRAYRAHDPRDTTPPTLPRV